MDTNKRPWEQDGFLEESVLKSCLLFDHKEKKNKQTYLKNRLLSLIVSGKCMTVAEIKKEAAYSNVGENIIDSLLNQIVQEKAINISDDGLISMSDNLEKEIDEDYQKIADEIDRFITDIIRRSKISYGSDISNEPQLKINIRNGLNYFFYISGYSFFGIDYRKEVYDLPHLEKTIFNRLSQKDKGACIFVMDELGKAIEKPGEYARLLNTLAKIYVVSQMTGIDPMLANFKRTQIGSKVFIIDTDVALCLMTKNNRSYRLYNKLIEDLLSCGCKLYLPDEVIAEIFHHAEAAKARYPFVSYYMSNDDALVPPMLNNVFVEDFYYSIRKSSHEINWENYLRNYYDKTLGIKFTRDVVIQTFGDKFIYGLPQGVSVDTQEEGFQRLADSVLQETYQTEKAERRDDARNRDIANTDTLLYLTTTKLNKYHEERIGGLKGRDDLLVHRYYILTMSTRVFNCANSLGTAEKVLCNPKALIAYFEESDLFTNGDAVGMINLFDNSFLIYTAKEIHDDIATLVNAGVDVKGANLVRLRYDLQNEIHELLTVDNTEKLKHISNEIASKGYKFRDEIQEILQENKNKGKEISDTKFKLGKSEQENSSLKEENETLRQQLKKSAQENAYLKKLAKKSKTKGRRLKK